MKFYPADWRGDPRLRMCSYAARGLWIDLISYMHEGEPYGHLTIDGIIPDIQSVAALTGRPVSETKKALIELAHRQVFSKSENGAIFSRRMVRDKAKADADYNNGKGGGNPKLIEPDNQWVNPPDKAQKPDSRIQSLERKKDFRAVADATRTESEGFEDFWKSYPKRKGANPRWPACAKFAAFVKAGVSQKALIGAAQRYADEIKTNGQERTPFVAQAVVWLNQRRWEDYPEIEQFNGKACDMAGEYHAAAGSPQIEAWDKHRLATEGKIYPRDKSGGWWFESEWPPQHQPTGVINHAREANS